MRTRFWSLSLVILLLVTLTCAPVSTLAEGVTYPIEGGKSVSWWMPMNGNLVTHLKTYSEHPVYKQLMANAGVNVDFVHPAIGQEKEEFSIMLASMELPDIIQTFPQYYSGGLEAALDDGVILDLTELVKEHAPDYYALISKDEETYKQFTKDGKILAFYTFWEELNPSAACITMRKDWLDQFGLKAEDMTTYAAVEQYFQGIKDNYPDVAPFMLNVKYDPYYYGFNMYPDTDGVRWYQVDGKVVYNDYGEQTSYRGWLTLMNSWYQKGYISPDFASYNGEQARSMFSAGLIGCFAEPIGNVYSDADASGLPIVKTPWWRQTPEAPINVYFPEGLERNGGQATVITSQCKNVVEAVKLLNYSFTDAGMLLTNYGVEGTSYTRNDQGEIQYTDLVLANPSYGTAVTHQLYRIHWIPNRKLADTTANPNITKRKELVEGRLMYAAGDPTMNGDYLLPAGVTLTPEEGAECGTIMNNVTTYIREMRLKFITGATAIDDTTWATYLAELDRMGLPRASEITQAAYDRYMGK